MKTDWLDTIGDHPDFDVRDSEHYDYEYIVFARFRTHFVWTFICCCPDDESVWEMFDEAWSRDHDGVPIDEVIGPFILTARKLGDDE